MKMNFQNLVNKGLLKRDKIGFDKIYQVISRANQTIKSARILLKNDDEEGGFQLAYESMLLAGRALVFSFGFRPRAAGSHKIVVDFAGKILGKEYKMLVEKFNKMRQKRNYLIYGIGLTISATEVKNAINTAKKFINEVEEQIEKKNPQRKLKL